ncbi:DUF2388 domain-containing protein [Pseudomonas sp. EKM23D]|uniref:DUF2388 domain-containing protein n=1 Tax=Pseudomonas TaxID=286 RepID=UPI00142E5762|nr:MULTISPECIES: DUF2388 domain-containing protein [Pseudomonas]KAF6689508.1 DUF2388 domain-containing protein [Pseudomonas sp. EKM23D]QKJ71836.1 DUF2388 domain-containing protein [Pseudomonas rhodesiae]
MPSHPLLLAFALSALPLLTHALEEKSPSERATIMTIGIPLLFSIGTTDLTMLPFEKFINAKNDALAFIGSDGEIRGAKFESAVRAYQASHPAPHMSDFQLAQAIAVLN